MIGARRPSTRRARRAAVNDGRERLGPEAGCEVRPEMTVVEQLPRPEAADVPVPDLRAGVELERRTAVRVLGQLPCGCVPQRPRHAQVDDQRAAAVEPPQQVLAAALDRGDPLPDERVRDERGVDGAGQPRVDDLHTVDRRALEHRAEPAPDGLDLGQLGHDSIVRAPPRPAVAAAPGYAPGARRVSPRWTNGGKVARSAERACAEPGERCSSISSGARGGTTISIPAGSVISGSTS